MARLHLLLRALILTALACTPAVMGCSCSDRPVDELEDRTEPACLWLISPYATLADGGTHLIYDEPLSRSGTVCLCLTQEEFDAMGDRHERIGWPESGTLLEEFNELAYEECKRLSGLIEDVVDDECLAYYEAGDWLDDIYFARGDWANGAPAGFTCDDR